MGTPFEIRYEASVIDPDDKEREEQDGMTTASKRLIQISTTANETEEALESTLLHEVIHAILGISGIAEILPDDKVEEGLVIALENGLSQLYTRI